MSNKIIVLTFLLLHVAINLHSNYHLELPERYDEDTYLAGLQARQNRLKESMSKITEQVNNLKNKLNSQQNNTQS
jgi:uncharacterized protein YlxW (UPF0749 family)